MQHRHAALELGLHLRVARGWEGDLAQLLLLGRGRDDQRDDACDCEQPRFGSHRDLLELIQITACPWYRAPSADSTAAGAATARSVSSPIAAAGQLVVRAVRQSAMKRSRSNMSSR